QLRVLNGIYLTNLKLNKRAEAEGAFGNMIEFGLESNRVAVKFLFPKNSAKYQAASDAPPYAIWVRQIARRLKARDTSCMTVVGHTSPTGTLAYNEALSLKRAEYIRTRLVTEAKDIT